MPSSGQGKHPSWVRMLKAVPSHVWKSFEHGDIFYFYHFVSFEKKPCNENNCNNGFCNKIYVNDEPVSWSPRVTNEISSKFNFN